MVPVAQSLTLSADLHLRCPSAKDYHLALCHSLKFLSVFLLPFAASSHNTVTSMLLLSVAPPPPCTHHVPSALLHPPLRQ